MLFNIAILAAIVIGGYWAYRKYLAPAKGTDTPTPPTDSAE